MNEQVKSKSPFYPGQPVPVELFVGRANEIDRIMKRGAGQVAEGKPISVFIEGEYGIGKSSIANYIRLLSLIQYKLHGVYVSLGGCSRFEDVSRNILEQTVASCASVNKPTDKLKDFLGKYVKEQTIFGVKIDFGILRTEAQDLNSHAKMLAFLKSIKEKLEPDFSGLFLILDEINGIASNSQFANFIKGLVDSNAVSSQPLPLLLMLCGVEERRKDMIRAHQPIDRIFDIVTIGPLSGEDTKEFFKKSFESVNMTVSSNAMRDMVRMSAGFPKIMHLIGDAAYWLDTDGNIDEDDSFKAILVAAEDVGKKYVDQQVYKALRSEDYRSILHKIASMGPFDLEFQKSEVAAKLSVEEKKKLDNFLQRMKKLNVIRSGDKKGEYVFNQRMVKLYIYLQSQQEKR